MPNGITPIIPEIHYEVRTIYGRDWLSLNINPYSYEILSTSVRYSFLAYSRTELSTSVCRSFLAYSRTKLSTSVRYSFFAYSRTELNHVTHLAFIPWFNLFYPIY